MSQVGQITSDTLSLLDARVHQNRAPRRPKFLQPKARCCRRMKHLPLLQGHLLSTTNCPRQTSFLAERCGSTCFILSGEATFTNLHIPTIASRKLRLGFSFLPPEQQAIVILLIVGIPDYISTRSCALNLKNQPFKDTIRYVSAP
jgi:hypothetical protein